MRRLAFILSVVSLCALGLGNASEPVSATPREFTGSDGCKFCHAKAESGDQFGQWKASGHANAYATLATPQSAQLVAKLGLSGNAQELDECLRCHVTAHGVAAQYLGKKYTLEDGVGCESCHGAGGDYKKKKIMEDPAACAAAGLQEVNEATCLRCHNAESPTYKGFDYAEMLAKVQHPNPQRQSSSR